MTDENGMLRNGSIDSVGTAGRELNSESTSTSSSATPTTTSSVNTTLSNNDGNNNENSTAQNRGHSDRQSQSQSHSPIDAENGNNNADNFVNSGCTSNGNYSSGTSNGSNANSKQPNHTSNYTNSNNGSPLHNVCGGRLQFFKDGKFILELARSKEGDKGWISVPRKTYWPPAALSQNSLNNHKNESSTSLSFSDDNSSIQSSPWQRDHSWKQLTPRKNISRDLSLYYYRSISLVLNEASILISKHIRRQPSKKTLTPVQYAKRSVQKLLSLRDKEKKVKFDAHDKDASNDGTKGNIEKDEESVDVVDNSIDKSGNKTFIDDDEKMDFKADHESNSKLEQKKTANIAKLDHCIRNTSANVSFNFRKMNLLRSPNLSNVIEKLITRVSEKPMNVTTSQTGLGIHFTSSSRSNDLLFAHQHVSPRKRILREFEKVSLEDRNSNTQKRSRSKSNVSSDCAMVGNSKPVGSNYSIVVAQQTANISCNNKEDNNQAANGSPPRSHSLNSAEVSTIEKTFKNSRTPMSTNTSKNIVTSNETASQPVSKPISNYSIISLLGHNNSNNISDSKNETNTEDKAVSENRGSSRSPMSYNHQMLSNNRSTYVAKKKSPPNSGNTLVNSPTNYRSARSPDINSPSPGLQHNSHHNRYHPASLSSPTSSFHPYLSSSRASPQSSGTLSPTDLYRHRPYRTAGSPSTMSNSSVSGLTHQYTPLNGSPTPFATRYSPSTYNSNSTKTSPTQSSQSQSLSSTYNVSNLLPQNYDANASSAGENHRFSPNVKHRTSDWSPARNAATSGRGSPSNYANSNNSLSTTTIPKKTASIRQKYGSLSPNGFAGGGMNSESTSSNKGDSNSGNKLLGDAMLDAKPLAKRSRSPTESQKKSQTQELYEKDLQARYNAEVAAMHHQSLIASALQQQAASPFYHMYSGGSLNAANLPPTMSAAAAYMNPLYYHHHPASEIFRKTHPSAAMDLLHKNLVPSWMDPYNASMMHYTSMSGSGLISDKPPLAATSQSEVHSMLMSPYSLGRPVSVRDQQPVADIETWNAANNKRSTIESPASGAGSAFRRQAQQFSEPISLIKDEPSSDVPLNLSKH